MLISVISLYNLDIKNYLGKLSKFFETNVADAADEVGVVSVAAVADVAVWGFEIVSVVEI